MPLVAVTGAAGFIGKNLLVRLREAGFETHPLTRETSDEQLRGAIGTSDVIFHLAGANRPKDPAEYDRSNIDYSKAVAEAVAESAKKPLLLFSSTAKAEEDSDYGRSKRAAEDMLLDLGHSGVATVLAYRLPNIFGKWARPNYNSAVATFCHNLARGLPVRIDDPDAPLTLVYIDDLIDDWLERIARPAATSGRVAPAVTYETTVGDVAERIRRFAETRRSGEVGSVASGLDRALYATFVSCLPPDSFSYALVSHVDERGSFTEMLRTAESGQVSCLTAHPGVTRGGHYHHSKVERFLVVHGRARFRFRNIASGETHEVTTAAGEPAIVETIPGWSHDITNIGDDLLVALLWANEPFDPDRPDTVAMPL
jgi:UDP-2-acetamido-2,6-beta-L-arabino-hexul-4-ose reductase